MSLTLDSDCHGARRPTLAESALSGVLRALPIKHGAHRLLDRVRPTAWAKGTSLVELPFAGRRVHMNVGDLVGWHFFMLRNFDPEVTEVLERFKTANGADVFWDIGANKGACSYHMAKALPRCRIVAIEPQQIMQSMLRVNLQELAPGRHEVFALGLGEVAGRFDMAIPSDNLGRASLIVANVGEHDRTEEVEVLTAQMLEQRSAYGWPSLVKIDVEGFEPSVIRSLQWAFKSQQIRCCVFECHANQNEGFAAIRAVIEPCGYQLFAIRKNLVATKLVPTSELQTGATDYAIVRADLR